MEVEENNQKETENVDNSSFIITKDIQSIPLDYQFLTLCVTQIPMDITKLILSFLQYDSKLMLGVGLACKSLYFAIIMSWHCVKVNEKNIRSIPDLVYQNSKCLVLDWFTTQDSEDISEIEFEYIFDKLNINLTRIEFGLRISSIVTLLKYIDKNKICKNLKSLCFSHRCFTMNKRDLSAIGFTNGNLSITVPSNEPDWGIKLNSLFPLLSCVENPPNPKLIDDCNKLTEMKINLLLRFREIKDSRFKMSQRRFIFFYPNSFQNHTRRTIFWVGVLTSLKKLDLTLDPSMFQYEQGERVAFDRFQNLINVRTLKLTVYDDSGKYIFPLSALRSMTSIEHLTLVDVYCIKHINGKNNFLRFSFDDFDVISNLKSLKCFGILDTPFKDRIFTPEVRFPGGGICGVDFPLGDFYWYVHDSHGYGSDSEKKKTVFPLHDLGRIIDFSKNIEILECCFRFTFMKRKELEDYSSRYMRYFRSEEVKKIREKLYDTIVSNSVKENLFSITKFCLQFCYQKEMLRVQSTKEVFKGRLLGGARTMQCATRKRPSFLPSQKITNQRRNVTKMFNLIIRYWRKRKFCNIGLYFPKKKSDDDDDDEVEIIECSPIQLELYRDIVKRFISLSLIFTDIEKYFFRCSCGSNGCEWKNVIENSLSKSDNSFKVTLGNGSEWMWKKQKEKILIVIDE